MLKDEIIKDERKTMMKIARLERRASEIDTREYPESDLILSWQEFNSSFNSSHKKVTAAHKTIFQMFGDEMVDLRPYMIHSPFTCTTTDKF